MIDKAMLRRLFFIIAGFIIGFMPGQFARWGLISDLFGFLIPIICLIPMVVYLFHLQRRIRKLVHEAYEESERLLRGE